MKTILRVEMDINDPDYELSNKNDCRNCPNFYLKNGHLYWCELHDKSMNDPLAGQCPSKEGGLRRVYLNGNIKSQWSIEKDSKLYKFLEDNYYTMNEDGIEKLVISEEALDDLLNCDEEFSKEEDTLIGRMIYNLDYCCAYLFY